MQNKIIKLVKNFYYTSKGEQKINSYHINIPKEIIKKAGYNDIENVEVSITPNNEIIIKKV